MKNIKIKFTALILGIACLAFSCNKNKEQCEKDEHQSHHGKDHGHGRDGKFGRGYGFHHSMNPDSIAKFRTEMMQKELSLTTEQVPKVEQLNLKYANKMKEIREQMKQLEEERKKELSGILTKEQMEKLEQRREHHRRAPMDSTQEDN